MDVREEGGPNQDRTHLGSTGLGLEQGSGTIHGNLDRWIDLLVMLTSKDFSKRPFANLAQDKVLSSDDGRRRAHLRRQWRYLWAPEEEEKEGKRKKGEGGLDSIRE